MSAKYMCPPALIRAISVVFCDELERLHMQHVSKEIMDKILQNPLSFKETTGAYCNEMLADGIHDIFCCAVYGLIDKCHKNGMAEFLCEYVTEIMYSFGLYAVVAHAENSCEYNLVIAYKGATMTVGLIKITLDKRPQIFFYKNLLEIIYEKKMLPLRLIHPSFDLMCLICKNIPPGSQCRHAKEHDGLGYSIRNVNDIEKVEMESPVILEMKQSTEVKIKVKLTGKEKTIGANEIYDLLQHANAFYESEVLRVSEKPLMLCGPHSGIKGGDPISIVNAGVEHECVVDECKLVARKIYMC